MHVCESNPYARQNFQSLSDYSSQGLPKIHTSPCGVLHFYKLLLRYHCCVSCYSVPARELCKSLT